MWLAIDAGNTHAVIGVFADGGVRPTRVLRLSTHPLGTADELRARLHGALASAGVIATAEVAPGASLDITLASVVPGFTRLAREAFAECEVIDWRWPFSFRIGTEEPSQTGIDRLVNAEAACATAKLPAILVDSGTATTICALSAEPAFLGGAILPGLQACADALTANAPALQLPELAPPGRAIGRGTAEALQSGLVLGYAAAVHGMIERFKKELPGSPRVIFTGGRGAFLKELLPDIHAELDPELTLRGIAILRARRREAR